MGFGVLLPKERMDDEFFLELQSVGHENLHETRNGIISR